MGRQGHQNFQHGIDILTIADYFTLGNRAHAYLEVSVSIGRYPEYRYALWQHLHTVKLFHWDADIRELAAAAMGRFAALDPGYAVATVLPDLLDRTTSAQLFERHGAILAIAEIVLQLARAPTPASPAGAAPAAAPVATAGAAEGGPDGDAGAAGHPPGHLTDDVLTAIRNIVPRAEKARAYRGRGGELVRAAACRLIECVCLAGHPLTRRAALRLLDTIEECLKHPYDAIQRAAAAALR